uniref:translocation/assembly module TamB domain-containing protein n=1 Tax=Spongiimicrobium salis TaxID=1667022 RepID=UPI00374D42E1
MRILLVLLLICVLSTIILSIPAVQTRFARYATDSINEEFGTNINIDRLKVSLISWDTSLKGIYVEDYKKDTLFYINELTTSILNVNNLMNGKLEFGDIDVDQLRFKLKTYQGAEDSNLGFFIDKLDDGTPRKPGTPPFLFKAEEINIQNSKFTLSDENNENPESLDFTKLNIIAKDFGILGPEVTSNITQLSFDDKRGLRVKEMRTDFKYTKEQMRFDSLRIATNASKIKGDLVFDYNREDFANFLDKVELTGNFEESVVALDEVNLLYNEFGKGKEVIFSSGINGVLNDLHAESLFLQSDNTGIRGDFNFKNLFSSKNPFLVDAKIKNITTSYYQLRSLLPNILGNSLPSLFKKLGQFTVRGDAQITESSIISRVNINTAIGSSYSDLELTDIDQIDNASYKGFVSFIDFDIGDFLDDDQFGKTSLDFNVDGKGVAQENLNTEVIGEVYSIRFNGYDYKNLKVSGIIKEQLFDGSLISNDENLKLDFKGLADFGHGKDNNFNFIASVDYADLKKLNFINDSVSIFKGNVNMDITGNSLDNIIGDIKFTKTNFNNGSDTYYFDDFKISSSFENDSIRSVKINSPDIITGYMKGKFKVNELGKLVQNSIGSIYTNYRPFEISSGQHIDFNFKIYNKIVDVFLPEVKFDPNTFIKGNIVADEGDFKLTFKSPSIEAYGNELRNIDVKVDNKNALYNTFVSVDALSTNYYDVKDFSLINTTLKDTLFFRTEFKGGSTYNDSYNLNFYHTFNKDNKSVIGLKKSDVNFKGNTWVLNKNGDSKNKVIINKTLDSIYIEEIVMNNSVEEQIKLRGQLADSTYKDLQLQFKIVSLDKITPEIDSLRLKGEVNGTLNIYQKDNQYLPSSNLNISDLSVNDQGLGDLTIGILGNRDLTEFAVNSQLVQEGLEKLSVIGKITNRGDTPKTDLLANFSGFSLEPFSPLGEGVITNIRGSLDGSARIQGDINNPDFNGILNLNNAGIAIPYLNVDYDFANNSRVVLYDQTFNFQDIRLSDIAENTRATLNGTINHYAFGDWYMNLNVDTNEDRFLILNTELEEESLYYGTGFLNGTGRIYGPAQALNIEVEGATARGTSLKIPISDVASVGDYSFISFVDKNTVKTIEQQRTLEEYQGLELSFDLDVTSDAEVEIVVDPKTGSSLKGTGEGILSIEINTNGKFEMEGEFVVVTGTYNYRFGGFIDKTFSVKPGGTILWEGDPLAAQLNMEAVYSLEANPAPLLDNSGYTRRIPTNVVVHLTEELEKPTIDFNIEFPGTNSIVQSELEYRLQDPTVEERNAFFLLGQGTFVNDRSGINQQALTGNLIQSANSYLNQLLSGDNENLNWGVSYDQAILDPTTDVQTESRIGVNISTKISDRLLFNGKFGVPVGGVSETVVAGDAELQILLNEEGTLSAKVFNRENEIQQFLADRQGYTQGVGLSYEVDFDTFKELMNKVFAKKKKEEKQEKKPVLPPTPANSKKAPPAETYIGNDSLIKLVHKTKIPK